MQTQELNQITVTDIKMPFLSMVFFMVKWVIASIPALFILMILAMFTTAFYPFLTLLPQLIPTFFQWPPRLSTRGIVPISQVKLVQELWYGNSKPYSYRHHYSLGAFAYLKVVENSSLLALFTQPLVPWSLTCRKVTLFSLWTCESIDSLGILL